MLTFPGYHHPCRNCLLARNPSNRRTILPSPLLPLDPFIVNIASQYAHVSSFTTFPSHLAVPAIIRSWSSHYLDQHILAGSCRN